MILGAAIPGVYALPWKAAARQIEKQATKGLLRMALRKSGSRIAGKILTGSRAWLKAFIHVAEHFIEEPVIEKGKHGVFKAALRSREALEPLIKSTVTKPSRRILGQLSVHGVNAGRFCVFLEKEFGEELGEELTQKKIGEEITRVPARILRVIVDYRGKPITAFPVAKFL